MKNLMPAIALVILTICLGKLEKTNYKNTTPNLVETDKIKVLNFATFHMGTTSDAYSVEFDEKDKKNQADTKKIAGMIAKFKPTVICVEVPLDEQAKLSSEYQKCLQNPNDSSDFYGEVGLIAFEVGKICKVDSIYGIDYEMSYNYNIGSEIKNEIDPSTINEFYSNPFKLYPELNVDEDKLTTLERLKLGNTAKCLDFLINVNADLLTYIGSKDGYEGADEAAKYYHRNLRIFSNLNRIKTTKEDRIFILSGGSHAAFLKEFIKRSPKYEMVNTLEYLK